MRLGYPPRTVHSYATVSSTVSIGEWTELEQALEGLLAAGNVEVYEDGEWLPEFTGLRYELRAERKAPPLIHLWSGERNLVRRILRVAECSAGQVVLEVQQFGRSKARAA